MVSAGWEFIPRVKVRNACKLQSAKGSSTFIRRKYWVTILFTSGPRLHNQPQKLASEAAPFPVWDEVAPPSHLTPPPCHHYGSEEDQQSSPTVYNAPRRGGTICHHVYRNVFKREASGGKSSCSLPAQGPPSNCSLHDNYKGREWADRCMTPSGDSPARSKVQNVSLLCLFISSNQHPVKMHMFPDFKPYRIW